MGINWRGAIRGAAEGVANVSQLMITDHVQQKRDANLARYQQQLQDDGQAHQSEMQMVDLTAQGVMQERKMLADQAQAEIEREQELADAAVARDHDFAMADYSGKVDPKASNLEVKVDNTENAFTKAVDSDYAALYNTLREQARSAGGIETNLRVLEEIGANTQTGFTPAIIAKIGSVLNTEAAASLQAYQAAVTPLILDQTKKLSGVISDTDMKVIMQSMPSFATDPRANKIIIGIIRKAAENAKKDFYEATEYIKNDPNGKLTGWIPANTKLTPLTEEAQSSIDAADNPANTINGAFDQWKRTKGGM